MYYPKGVDNKPISGVSKIKISPDKERAMVYIERFQKDGGEFKTVIETHKLLVKNCPSKILTLDLNEKYYVTVEGNGIGDKQMTALYPADGDFYFSFKGLWAKEGEQPKPYPRPNRFDPTKPDDLFFNATIQFEDELWKDQEVILWALHFNFAPGFHPDYKYPVLDYSKKLEGQWKSPHTIFLNGFLMSIGFWDDGPREYSDNPLPEIDAVGKAKKLKFKAKLNHGRVSEFYPPSELDKIKVNSSDEGDDDWGEDWSGVAPTEGTETVAVVVNDAEVPWDEDTTSWD